MSPSRRHNFAVYLAAAWSGYFVMGIELLGGRLLAPYFGNSIFVWGALIAVFMACLAFGYLLGGQASLRSPSLRKLGLLLLGAALLALPVVFGGDTALDALSLGIRDLRYGALAGATLLFGGTAVVSGMVSPYAVRLLVDDVDGSGRSAGRLYFASTLGSAAGTIFTSFYLVLWFEVNHIVLGMLLVSGLIATALIAMGSRRREVV